jgi:osmotically-inducible protein OsmY
MILLAAMGASSLSGGCAVMAAGAAAGAGVMAMQDRSLWRGIDDSSIASSVKVRLLAFSTSGFAHVGVDVNEGQVLLSGAAPNDQARLDAERIAWGVKGVSAVSNEITVGRAEGLGSSAHDEWITTRVHAKLLADPAIKGINFNVETRRGVVYLMGVARNEDEKRRAAEAASYVGGVTKVVSYIQVRPAPTGQAMAAGAGAAPIEQGALEPAPRDARVAGTRPAEARTSDLRASDVRASGARSPTGQGVSAPRVAASGGAD